MNVQHQLIKNKKRNTASKQCFKHTALTLAVLGVMPLLSYQVQAACTGTLAAPVVGGMAATITTQCSGAAGSNITNTDATTYVDNATKTNVGGNTLIQLDGQGRMLINSGSIINNEVINTGTSAAGNRNRVAVLIGAATANNAAFTTTPSGGQTNINVPNATAAFVGQTVIIGRFDSIEGDLFAGDTRTITAIVSGAGTANAIVTLASPLASNPAPNGPQSLPLRYKVISNFGGGQDIINNSGTISTSITTAEINGNKAATGTTSVSNTSSSRAVTSSAEGSYMVNNSATGTIKATHAGIGATYAVEAGGAVIDMTINNNGLLQAERTATVSAATFIPTANPTGVVLGLAAQTLAQVNAINTQEELDAITINNSATGIIRATGDYSGAIYMRAGEQTINNAGLIEHTAGKPGFAIGSVSDGGEIRTFELTNIATGTINGDILAVNGNALRYYGLITGGVPAASTLGINNQFGEEQSDISNAGKINSNIYYANGAHDLENAVGGVITGNINVDQRDNKFAPTTATCTPSANTVCQAVGTTNTAFSTNTQRIQTITASGAPNSFGQPVTITTQFNIAGAKTFVLVNAGALNGNLTIVNGVASSAITNASIAGRVSNNAIENSGDWIGNLNITNVAGAINSITNEGTLTGNITLTDVAGALNTVNLSDNGFVGNIAAITGAGTNTLNIVGAGTSQGNVSKFSTINFVTDDYTIVAGNMFEANSASINAGNFKLLGNLIANTTVTSNATLMGNGTNIGSLTNSGAVNLADTTLNVTGDFISTAGASISTLITPTAFGVLATTGSATVTDTTVKTCVSSGLCRAKRQHLQCDHL